MDIDLPRLFESLLDGLLGNLVEHHAENARAVLAALKFLLEVVADGLPLAVRIGREIDLFPLLGGLLQLVEKLLFTVDDFIPRLEAVFDVHRQIFLGKILDMTERGFDYARSEERRVG